jgi:hypothetical protein
MRFEYQGERQQTVAQLQGWSEEAVGVRLERLMGGALRDLERGS